MKRSKEPKSGRVTMIALVFTDAEWSVVGELLRIGPYSGLDELVYAGLWQLAKQLDVPVTTFALGRRGKP